MKQELDHTIPFEELPFHLPLKPDDLVFISSDVKNVALEAKKRNKSIDIDLFINNLQKVLFKGSLVIPAYTDHLKDGATFDLRKSKPTTGAISNKVFKRTDFKRTDDVLHSVFIWGKLADEVDTIHDQSTFGENSIFGFLHRSNALFMFIDVHIVNSFTFVHYVEEKWRVPYRKYYDRTIRKIDGAGKPSEEKILFHTKKPGVVTDFDELNETFLKRGKMAAYSYQGTSIHLISARDAVTIIEEKLGQKKYLYRFSLKEFIKTKIKNLLKK